MKKKLSKIDTRTDGEVEVIDVKLNNRKTKKIGDEKTEKTESIKIDSSIPESISSKIINAKKTEKVKVAKVEEKNNTARFRMQFDRRKGYIQKAQIGDHKVYLHTGEYNSCRNW